MIAMVFERKYSHPSRFGQSFIDEQLIRNCSEALEKRIRQLKLLTSTGNIQGRKIILKCLGHSLSAYPRHRKLEALGANVLKVLQKTIKSPFDFPKES